jgi:hypothetical protein
VGLAYWGTAVCQRWDTKNVLAARRVVRLFFNFPAVLNRIARPCFGGCVGTCWRALERRAASAWQQSQRRKDNTRADGLLACSQVLVANLFGCKRGDLLLELIWVRSGEAVGEDTIIEQVEGGNGLRVTTR